MKKLMTIVATLVLVLTIAAGCGNTNESSTSGNGAGAAAEESLRGSSISGLDAFDLGNATLEDINTRDTEGSFRAGAGLSTENFESIA